MFQFAQKCLRCLNFLYPRNRGVVADFLFYGKQDQTINGLVKLLYICVCVSIYIYIYIYITRTRARLERKKLPYISHIT
jgi:hypothetical protein